MDHSRGWVGITDNGGGGASWGQAYMGNLYTLLSILLQPKLAPKKNNKVIF
jgi:hypothetical protein